MINPETIDISVLPFVALETRQALPPVSAIYFAIDSLGTVQYIGKSINLRSRWTSHHKHSQLELIGGCRISWMEVDLTLLDEIEIALIQWFDPPLNGLKCSSKPKKRLRAKRKVPRRKAIETTLSEREWEILEAIADKLECSYAEAIRCAVVAYPNSSASNN